jgi:hypothetical protein
MSISDILILHEKYQKSRYANGITAIVKLSIG